MREIKFRGKLLNKDEWVYGYYLQSASTFIAVDDRLVEGHWNVHKVDYETVGQYTGQKDKNGVEIYEGDIVQSRWDLILVKHGKTGFIPYRSKHGIFSKVTNWEAATSGEVIGNIYDNPELLNGGDKGAGDKIPG